MIYKTAQEVVPCIANHWDYRLRAVEDAFLRERATFSDHVLKMTVARATQEKQEEQTQALFNFMRCATITHQLIRMALLNFLKKKNRLAYFRRWLRLRRYRLARLWLKAQLAYQSPKSKQTPAPIKTKEPAMPFEQASLDMPMTFWMARNT